MRSRTLVHMQRLTFAVVVVWLTTGIAYRIVCAQSACRIKCAEYQCRRHHYTVNEVPVFSCSHYNDEMGRTDTGCVQHVNCVETNQDAKNMTTTRSTCDACDRLCNNNPSLDFETAGACSQCDDSTQVDRYICVINMP